MSAQVLQPREDLHCRYKDKRIETRLVELWGYLLQLIIGYMKQPKLVNIIFHLLADC